MWQHHLIIEGQRKGKKGLISGIKKDVVLSANLLTAIPNQNHEAIYGWHKPDGKAIQPLYTGILTGGWITAMASFDLQNYMG